MIKKFTAKHRATIIQFCKFGTVGAVGFVLDNCFVYYSILELGLTRTAAGFLSYPFIITCVWLGNRWFTFREAKRERMYQQGMKFALVCLIGLVFNRGTYSILVNTVPLVYQHPVIGLFAGTCAGMFFNFFTSRKLVFR